MKAEGRTTGWTSRWLRFAAGLLLLMLAVSFLMTGYTPPGIAGEVLGHNRHLDIDASPLFYSEVEHMSDLEAGVRRMILAHRGARTLFSRPICEDIPK